MRRASLLVLLAVLAGRATDAHAQGWSSFTAAFPSFPCQDGWMACLVGGAAVTPELANGELAGQRVGWFDLKATGSFSPFVSFSPYDKVGAVAAAAPEPEAPSIDDAYADVEDTPETKAAKEEAKRADAEAAEARKANDEARQAAAEAESQRRAAEAEAKRQREEEEQARRAAEEAARKAAQAASQAQASERARLEQEAAEAKRKADEAERQRKAAEAAAAAKAKAEDEARRRAAEEEKKRLAAEQAKAQADAAARAKLEAERVRQEDERRKQEEAQRAAQEAERRKAEEESQRQAQAEAQAAQQAALAAAQQAAELKRQREEAERARQEAAAKAAATADAAAAKQAAAEAARLEAEAKRLAEEQRAAEEKRKAEEARQAEARRKAEEEARIAEERRVAAEKAEAERKAAEAKKAEEQRLAAERAKQLAEKPPTSAPVPPPAPSGGSSASPGAGGCDLIAFETSATLGKLTSEQMSSCENALNGAAKMTDKKKYSLLLQTNAWSKGDKSEWEKLVKRHLEEIDASDPDMAYKYALHLGKLGPGRASGAIKYADVALENRTVWTGDTYTQRVYSLYKVKVVAAQAMWRQAEEAHSANPSDETRKKSEDRRNATKVYAREWYEYAKSVGRDTADALQVCTSAAGTADYCEN